MNQDAILALIKTCNMLNNRLAELEYELEMLKKTLL